MTKEKLKKNPPTEPSEAATQNSPATDPTTEAEGQVRYLYDQIKPMLQNVHISDNSKICWRALVKQIGLPKSSALNGLNLRKCSP